MSLMDAYRRWQERRREAAWEREALTAGRAIDAALDSGSLYDAAYHYRGYLETVRNSRFKDRYDEESAKAAMLGKLHRTLEKGGRPLEEVLGAEPGYRPLGDVLAELGITRDEIAAYHDSRVRERRAREKEILLHPLRAGRRVDVHDLVGITSKAREYDLTPDEHAGLRGILLQTLTAAAQADIRWLSSNDGIAAYQGLKDAIQSYGATADDISKACGNADDAIRKRAERLAKHQDRLYESALRLADRGDPNTIPRARRFIRLSRQYSTVLEETRETLGQAVEEIDRRYTAGLRVADETGPQ
jgi:hypothetical protein